MQESRITSFRACHYHGSVSWLRFSCVAPAIPHAKASRGRQLPVPALQSLSEAQTTSIQRIDLAQRSFPHEIGGQARLLAGVFQSATTATRQPGQKTRGATNKTPQPPNSTCTTGNRHRWSTERERCVGDPADRLHEQSGGASSSSDRDRHKGI